MSCKAYYDVQAKQHLRRLTDLRLGRWDLLGHIRSFLPIQHTVDSEQQFFAKLQCLFDVEESLPTPDIDDL